MNNRPIANGCRMNGGLKTETALHPATDRLVFVCNVESGAVRKMTDVFRRLISPEEACPLYTLTHNGPHLKKEWNRFRETLPLPCELLCCDGFLEKYGSFEPADADGFSETAPAFPSVFVIRRHGGVSEGMRLIGADRIGRCGNLSCFEKVVRRYLEKTFPDTFGPAGGEKTDQESRRTAAPATDKDRDPAEWRRRKEAREKIKDVSEDISP